MFRTALILVVACAWHATSVGQRSAAQSPSPVEVSVASGGIRRYEPGVWSVLTVTGRNWGDTDAEPLISVYFDSNKGLQYGRRFWIPARAQRRTVMPVHVPALISPSRNQIQLTTLVLNDVAGREVLTHRDGDLLVRKLPLILDHEPIKTGVVFPNPSNEEEGYGIDYRFYEHVIVAGRSIADLSRTTIEFGGVSGVNPSMPMLLGGLDQMIVADDRLMEDSGSAAAVRQWLHTGGRVWLPLDRVGAEVVATLVGHAVCVEEVDRVELSTYTLEDLTQEEDSSRYEEYEFEEPIEFIRVLTDCADIHCRINGWPAAFWQPVGGGEVLFTTLEATGFSRSVEQRPPAALQSIAHRLFQMRQSQVVAPQAVEPMLQEQIGYRVPERSTVALILGAHCLCLVIVGVWFGRCRRLDRMAIAVPLVTLSAAIALIVIGRGNTRRVPSTAASVQVVQVVPETGEAYVSGVTLLYHQQTGDLHLASRAGGIIVPDPETNLGETRRFVWTDDDGGRWPNLTLNSGAIQPVRYQQAIALSGPVRVPARFGPDGLRGRLQSDGLGTVTDPVIVAPPGHALRVSLNRDGSFTSGVEDVLPPGEYLVGMMLSDNQRRRHSMLRKLLDPTDRIPFPRHPSLLVWGPPLDVGFDFAGDYETEQSALSAIPLAIERTSPGSPFVVPASFVGVDSVVGESGKSVIFNPRSGEWLENWVTTHTELRFIVPRQVQPCRIERARLVLKLNVPSRTLEVVGLVGQRRVLLQRWKNPNGIIELNIERADLLNLDEDGALNLLFIVGKSESESGDEISSKSRNSTWKIEYVRMDVYGTTDSI
ncbi:MAG: hypothetical protein ACC628_05725 [Pirellulaceae bacterium]